MLNLFPHDTVRPVQKGFMRQVEAALVNKQHLIAHCPTGLGKTAAALTPALDYALKNNKTVFFLTSRHTQHEIAVNTLKLIRSKHNIQFNVADIIGKKWMCCQNGVNLLMSNEFSDYCKEMKEKRQCVYYNNIRKANKLSYETKIALNKLKEMPCHVEDLKKLCAESKLCPYEIACLLAKDSKVIIADYYHFLQPSIREKLLKRLDQGLNESIIIMDEGHNLPSRARELLTTNVSTFVLDNASNEAKAVGYADVAENLIKIKEKILKLAATVKIDKTEKLVTREEVCRIVEDVVNYEELCSSLRFVGEEVIEFKKRSFANSVANFFETWTGPDESFVRLLIKNFKKGKVNVSLHYKCLDPSIVMKDIVNNAHSIILMSGTLTPTEMYKDLLGFDDTTVCAEYDNPFPVENRLTLVVPKTSTKFETRSKFMYKRIANECARITNNVHGNCVVFFPSYMFMNNVYETFMHESNKSVLVEEPGLSKEAKSEKIEEFKSYKEHGAVLLAVSSGSFGEGIDLVGDFLKCVVVVGLPLNKPDIETNELIKYYDAKYGNGWDYGYILPAIITTLQNAGRCIRSDKDRGVIAFLDERYVWPRYFKCFPKDWNLKVTLNPEQEVKRFFNPA